MKRSNPTSIIVMGSPGAGKGTQAELVSQRLNLTYLETSKLLEEKFRAPKEGEYVEAEGKKYFLTEEKKLWETGFLNSPPFVTAIVVEKIQKLFSQKKSVLFAGSPRTLEEGRVEMPLLAKLYGKENIFIIVLEVREEEVAFRNAHRRLCQLMRHPILYSKETETLQFCPLDGSPLVRREGLDDPEVMHVRLKEYRERTEPLLRYFKEEGFTVHTINGAQSVADVFGDIVKVLPQ
ncbi:MAG: nucleoside monophosphate kinase [bacterium]|nr:nucleoside monophosphate kinase [bacterium]